MCKKRAVIIGGGDFGKVQAANIKKDDFVICADRGYDNAAKFGICADCVIGDMDSVRSVPPEDSIVYPRKKDYTDGELAVRYATEHGYGDIVLMGFTGERLDHTLSDIFMLDIIAESGARGVLIDEYNIIYYLCEKQNKLNIGKKGDNLSLVPLCDLIGVYTKGLEYPINNEDIRFFASRTLCNYVEEDGCEIGLSGGRALIIISKDREKEKNDIS